MANNFVFLSIIVVKYYLHSAIFIVPGEILHVPPISLKKMKKKKSAKDARLSQIA